MTECVLPCLLHTVQQFFPADSKQDVMRKFQEQPEQISQEGRELHARSWEDGAPDKKESPTRPTRRSRRREGVADTSD
jgi:hypothetical protein